MEVSLLQAAFDSSSVRSSEDSASENRFQTIVENFFGGIFILDDRFKVTYANDELARMFGDRKENILGHDFREFLDDESREQVIDRYVKRQSGEKVPSKYELAVRDKEGNKRIVEISATPLASNAHKVETICQMIDITEQKQALKRLQDSKKRLKTLFEYAPDAYYITDMQGVFIEGNRAAEEFIGYKKAELVGKNYLKSFLLVPGQEKKAAELISRCRDRDYTGPVEFQLRHKNGHVVTAEIRTAPYNIDGQDVILGIARDITERKSAQNELAKMASVIDQVNSLVVITNLNGIVIYVNRVCEDYWCNPASSIVGKHFLEQHHGILTNGLIDEMWSTLKGGDPWQGVIIREKKDGAKFYEDVNAFPIRNSEGAIINYAAVTRDVTSEMLLKEQLQQKQRLESIGHMASGVAHDFNNILNVIMGYSEMAMGKIDQDDPVRHYISEVTKAGKRASDLTRQLLAFSRKQVYQPQIISVNTIISDMRAMFQKMAGDDITVKCQFSPDINPVKADPSQLEQVMMNLILNARDAINLNKTDKNTRTITIRTDDIQIGKTESDLAYELIHGDYVTIEVTDSGTGISPQIINSIFDPFFTTKRAGEGTGLGLSTVYGIVKQNKGTIRVQSKSGTGSTFKMYWPVYNMGVTPTESRDKAVQETSTMPTVLAVEDDPAIRTFIKYVFQKTNYNLLIAKNGRDAQLQTKNPGIKIDLLFTDIVMPEMNGKELAINLRKSNPGLKVLFSSGYSDDIIVKHGKLEKNTYFIQKPYNVENLKQMIDSIIGETEK